MTTSTAAMLPPMAPGDAAPDFALPAVAGPEVVSLDQYRGRSPLFLALLLGLWCPFCRRQLVQLGNFESRLKALGVETVAVVATEPENARLYFKFRPTRLRLAADPDLTTHRAYRVPKPEPTPDMLQAMAETRINPFGDLPEPLPIAEVAKLMQERDGYAYTPTDQGEVERQWPQLKALFLIDREGIVRWANIECGAEGLAGIGKFPSEEVILDAARACVA
ncbi:MULTISPECIES: redoxin domain-containing protein [unclassified Variovorax]|uniref:redoxin domain-containing protein n=1 Tax=unclassified Variovorax TaxID=663243 RepID=UPI0013166858|nr:MULTISPECIES: redoxin domain-containing protein [unclassified Variovorax]VTU45656.1 thiol-disulfide oxidoreductase [Variovorax sp. PBL-E5]VTU46576.1 thiol-disulfide oxidoreductase [Variovorax sp. SRS16]